MHPLSPFTCRRLGQLPRLTSVWECDRRSLEAYAQAISAHDPTASKNSEQGDCILWVDTLQGMVRGLSVVPKETGHEAVVRALLQAIESPQGNANPARPRKVVVCNREIQFFLRGALQDLDIDVEYAFELPAVDQVFEKLQAAEAQSKSLSAATEELLFDKSNRLWQDAPWQHLSEQEILAIELNCWDIDTLYLSILGIAGIDYGLLFYRDLKSLRQFRHQLRQREDFSKGMQQAFLEQNCLFLNFHLAEDVIPIRTPQAAGGNPAHQSSIVDCEFGSIHPLEGLRSQIVEEEALSLIVVLEALHRFLKKHDISTPEFALGPVNSRFRIPNPSRQTKQAAGSVSETVSVKIFTVPEVSAAFLAETVEPDLSVIGPLGEAPLGEVVSEDTAPLIDDSVPEGALIMIGSHPNKKLEPLRKSDRIHYQSFLIPPDKLPKAKAHWPVLTIQATRPKAHQLVQQIQQEGGLQAICFNAGSDPVSGQIFQVGLLQTALGHLHLFNEYEVDSSSDNQALDRWQKASEQNNRCGGCIIATGASGSKRGRPTGKEVIAFFELRDRQPEEIGLVPLVMSYAVDWDQPE
ncbi:MAG: hypothetical protein DCF25_05000 [Leptolyngbya foveolarum]|uniref:Uncharacterized protein n=1 Tax=Leptolyngbya foveolarum TaxID=47253 RepID=A0A2W4UK69_9CYAN|nr:MAG: hypothetical protein DCF25_05000 [Leptolyngbya foveolarum]